MGQCHALVGVRRSGSDKKKKEADRQQGDPETQNQRMKDVELLKEDNTVLHFEFNNKKNCYI